MALRTVLDSLGVADEGLAEVRAWYADIAAALGNCAGASAVRERGREAWRAFGERVLARRATVSPRSRLAGLPFSEPEVAASATILVFGGLETTAAAMLGNAAWALLRHPEQLAAVRRDAALLAGAVEEALRWESPVQTCTRHTTRAVEVGGVAMGAGETVQCMLGSG